MNFGNILALAPMASVTTPVLRVLIEDFGGCDLYFSEMINAASLIQEGPYEKYYVEPGPVPGKLVHQIVGGKEESIIKAGAYLNEVPGYGIDFNMGCCAPEILKAGGGIMWMRDLDRARSLINRLRSAVTRKSLSVKLRVGFDDDPDYLLRFCGALAQEGLDFLTLHPRLKKEKFSRIARWEYVDLLKRELDIPVLGNGDIKTYDDYVFKKSRYQADGIMIGRSAARAPWFFAFLRKKEKDPETAMRVDLQEVAMRFLELLPRYQPEDFLESRAKKFFAYFCGNLFFGHRLGSALVNAEDYAAIIAKVETYFRDHPDERIRIEKSGK